MTTASKLFLASLTIALATASAFGQAPAALNSRTTGEPPLVVQGEQLPPPKAVPDGTTGDAIWYQAPPCSCQAAPSILSDSCCSGLLCGPTGRFFFSFEGLLWSTSGANTPPLVTRGAAGSNAALTTAGTTVLAGGGTVLDDPRNGGRITAGLWSNRIGIELRAFALEQTSAGFTVISDGTGNFGIPFFSTAGVETALLFASVPPGATVNGITSASASTRFGGVEINPAFNVVNRGNFWLDFFLGYRFLGLDDDFRMTTISQTVGASTLTFNGAAITGATRTISDSFHTSNELNAGQLGSRAQWLLGPLYFDIQSKVALGSMHQVLEIQGFTTANSAALAPNPQTFLRGMFASGTNFGSRSRDVFVYSPELAFNVGLQLSPRVRVFGGYTLLWMSNVVRATEQIDRTLNPTQVPSLSAGPLAGASRPQAVFNETDFWAQGANLGLLLQF